MKIRYMIWVVPVLIFVLTGCLGGDSEQVQTETVQKPSPTISTPLPTQTMANEASAITVSPPPNEETSAATPIQEIINPTPAETSQPTQEIAEPSPTPTSPSGEITSTPPAGSEQNNCTNLAAFYGDVNIPDNTMMRQGEEFVKTWRIRNEGTCVWGQDYDLVFASGSNMNAPLENPLPETAPGNIIEVSVNLTAPNRGGEYASYWEFQSDQDVRFGVGKDNGWIWALIAVSWVVPTENATETSNAEQPTGSPSCEATRNSDFEMQLLTIINNARESRGLNPLKSQDQLAAAALAHSTDMACNGFVDHIGSDGSLWYDRVSAQGYANYNSARENIRVGFPDFGFTPQYVYDQWFISQVHHDNMFYSDVSEAGVGYVFNPNSEYGGYVTIVFARP